MLSGCVRCVLPGTPGVALKFAILPLFLLSMGTGLAAASRFKERAARSKTVAIAALLSCLLFVAIPIFLVSDWPAPRYSPLVITGAGAFDWPVGCAKKIYNVGDAIGIACKEPRNALPRRLVLDHAFPDTITRGDRTYYRIGSDAVLPACIYFNNTCTVRRVQRDVFR
jgi:hypothetical protein